MHMNISRISNQPENPVSSRFGRRSVSALLMLKNYPVRYSLAITTVAVLVLALAIIGTAVANWLLAVVAVGLLLGGVTLHAVLSGKVRTAQQDARGLEQRLADEASSSRVLAGIKLLASVESPGDSSGLDARLAAAARMATGYAAAFVFNLHDAHGVFVPSTRKTGDGNFKGQLNLTGDEFEPVDGQTPGAIAARQGSALVMSLVDSQGFDLPVWAEQAGFLQGIVTPVTRGLDTIGVVYVFSKATVPPTLNEIEQLELIVSFASNYSQVPGTARPGSAVTAESGPAAQPFRIPDGRSERRASLPTGISMPGFALNPELERMELDGISLSLSPTEFLLVNALASSPGRPVSPDALVNSCWAPDARPADNGLDVAIFRLRRKLSKTTSGKGLIKTVRGSGYMFVPPAINGAAVVAD
jgi:DNA-binding winged helix-turn-helix (wHTH) protein